jgi:hypothetical protein
MKLMTLRKAIPLLFVLLASCSLGPQPYEVHVDSLAANTSTSGQSFVLASAMKDTPPTDLQFQEFASYLYWALQEQGFVAAQDAQDADLVISLSYGVSDPIEKREYFRQPIWERSDAAYVYRPRNYGSRRDCPSSIGYFPVARHSIVGYTEGSRSITVYNQFLRVEAHTNGASNSSAAGTEVWTLNCQVTDERDDLRVAFPAMLAAAKEYFGRNSGRVIPFEIDEDDPSVLELRSASLP